jgi:hypothetical protein
MVAAQSAARQNARSLDGDLLTGMDHKRLNILFFSGLNAFAEVGRLLEKSLVRGQPTGERGWARDETRATENKRQAKNSGRGIGLSDKAPRPNSKHRERRRSTICHTEREL